MNTYHDHAQSISFPATGSQRILGGTGLLMGWAVLETGGVAAATLELYDGFDATAQLVAVIALLASQSTRDWLGPGGVQLSEGLFVNVVSGTVRGVCWVRMRHQGAG
ncbi:MAG TPA: hypothetical protein VHQ90_00075 [Thermoanaerobaculia bacterium]|nr:hypothetical protein [Thermoanaerobaculia bacterium]